MRRITLIAIAAALVAGAVVLLYARGDQSSVLLNVVSAKVSGGYTVQQRMDQYSVDVRQRLAPAFAAAGLPYPPYEIAYIGFKDQRTLDVYARGAATDPWRFVKRYPVLAASGKAGPKLREGDRQVPEGIYRVESLNPNSRFHLSIRVNYPNDFDRSMAQQDGRTQLGGDIMIHGNAVSIGCLAMGDAAAEELFILAALATPARTRIVISPTDFRKGQVAVSPEQPAWLGTLYQGLKAELTQYPR